MSSMSFVIPAITFSVGTMLIVIQAWIAYEDKWFFPGQMLRHHSQGLPFIGHLGMWGDIPLTFFLTAIVAFYGTWWIPHEVFRAFLIAVILSAFLHYSYTQSSFPEAHVRDHKLTGSGWTHAAYMTGAFMILKLFYFPAHAQYVEPGLVISLSIFLGIHVLCATHVPLSLCGLRWFPEKPHKNPMTWITLLTAWAFLIWRTYVLTR